MFALHFQRTKLEGKHRRPNSSTLKYSWTSVENWRYYNLSLQNYCDQLLSEKSLMFKNYYVSKNIISKITKKPSFNIEIILWKAVASLKYNSLFSVKKALMTAIHFNGILCSFCSVEHPFNLSQQKEWTTKPYCRIQNTLQNWNDPNCNQIIP